MNRKSLFGLLIFFMSTVESNEFFQYEYNDGPLAIYYNGERLILPKNNFLIAESSEAESVDLNGDKVPEIMLKIHNNTKNTPVVIFLSFNKASKELKEIKSKNTLINVDILNGGYITSNFSDLYNYEELYEYNEDDNNFKSTFKDQHFDENVVRYYPNGTQSFLDNNNNILKRRPIIGIIKGKTYLYNGSNSKGITGMYLIKGDKVTIIDELWDKEDKRWYFIKYKGKKNIYKWIQGSAVKFTTNLSADTD